MVTESDLAVDWAASGVVAPTGRPVRPTPRATGAARNPCSGTLQEEHTATTLRSLGITPP
jgi:hypothetical protein